MLANNSQDLHQQATDLQVLNKLIPFLSSKLFIDIGAEKGTFTNFLTSQGMQGFIFEPLPKFADELAELADKTNSKFYPYAIDAFDHTADFYAAYDVHGNALDYFSSLYPLNDDLRIMHKKITTATCKSLNSLLNNGEIPAEFGIIKIDTEGNDLNVLKGMQAVNTQVLMCEYFMPDIYAGWPQGHPLGLIEAAKDLGFEHYISINRLHHLESIHLNFNRFIDKQWGNLIFIKTDVYLKAQYELLNIINQVTHQTILDIMTPNQNIHDELLIKEQEIQKLTNILNIREKNYQIELDKLLIVCQERLEEINNLKAICEERLTLINQFNQSITQKILNKVKV